MTIVVAFLCSSLFLDVRGVKSRLVTESVELPYKITDSVPVV